MRLEHIALWAKDLEALRQFYQDHFQCVASAPYHNPRKGFRSYFMTFPEGGRIELMHSETGTGGIRVGGIHVGSQTDQTADQTGTGGIRQDAFSGPRPGYAHFALSVGSEDTVRALTQQLEVQGVRIAGQPRWTGDGYYESVVLDPEGNQIEITI